ncbi:uncharacterized protein JN550_013782 [Neoarthrinium moseri]|uniref:uncharacterized protein n=1 Tax=Neoarthrinium moseri TaxID=1658444 RepID=UPI001FDBAF13|nr:uncharacterized protein JN550_013782 [Neoarthrinium moseri]KAI1856499.1 hypothetical protein JN550_013782 [Neoarthrinium moseri]
MKPHQRNNTVAGFTNGNGIKVMLISLHAGNCGLNLSAASHVILMDPCWNPWMEDQAIGRAHRIGQTQEVQVHRILAEGTVEDRIVELQQQKPGQVNVALDEAAAHLRGNSAPMILLIYVASWERRGFMNLNRPCNGSPPVHRHCRASLSRAPAWADHITRQRRQKKSNDLLVSFFFNARGNELEKSTIGLYRSLLWQLLSPRPDLQAILDGVRPDRPWTVDSLKSLLEEVVQGKGGPPITCLIDALDECDEQQIRDIVSFLTGLARDSLLYICFASRHYPEIFVTTGLGSVLEEREGHQENIAAYLSSSLRIGHDRLAEEIWSDLKEKACGVFMWVVLVVDTLNKEYDTGRKHRLRERLQQLPDDLHELFRDILTRDTRNRKCLLFFEDVIAAVGIVLNQTPRAKDIIASLGSP